MSESISGSDPDLLDSESFPFTIDEVERAAELWCIPGTAAQFAREIAHAARGAVENRQDYETQFPQLLQRSPRATVSELAQFRVCDYTQVYWLWPTLSVLSSSSARATERIAEHWRRRLAVELLRMRRVVADGSADEMRAIASELVEAERQTWLALADEARVRLRYWPLHRK